MNPAATAEISTAWEAARRSPIWKEAFLEYKVEGKQLVYLRKEYEIECEIADYLRKIAKGKKAPFADPGYSLCGIDFDEDQNELLNLVSKHPIVIADGGPGAGKTTLGKELKLRADSAGLVVQGLAFLGKAAARVRYHTGIPAHTIHRVYYSKKGNQWTDLFDNPVRTPDLIVIDEAAMISDDVFLMAVKEAAKTNARLVILGDGAQLEPIGAGAPFLQMIKSGLFPVVHLRGQHRSGSGIVEACQAINRGEFPKNNDQFQFVERPDHEKFEHLEKALEGKDHNETQIVTTSNNERRAVNNWYRARKGYDIDQIYKSERICGNRNVRTTGARNGEIGVVIGFSTRDVNERKRRIFQVQFANNPMLPYYAWPSPAKKEDKRYGPHPDLDWAYCLTGNKCQGSEWNHLTGAWLKGRPWATRKWLYTCVSRGRKWVVIYGNRRLVELILANGADCYRITMLSELLRKTFKTPKK